MGAPILWFRPSIRKAALRVSLTAIAFTVGGAFILGAMRVAGVDFGSPWLAAYAVGLACVIAGPVLLWRGHLRWLGHERVLTISADGLRWQVGDDRPWFCAWRELGPLRVEGAELVIATAGEPWRLPLPFEGIAADALIRLIGELAQKALLGLPVRPRDGP